MTGKTFLMAAILGAVLTFGISGTSSAAELSSNFFTMQVESQELSNRHRMPPPPPPHRYDRDRYSDYGRTGYSRYSKPKTSVRRVNVNVTVTRRV